MFFFSIPPFILFYIALSCSATLLQIEECPPDTGINLLWSKLRIYALFHLVQHGTLFLAYALNF